MYLLLSGEGRSDIGACDPESPVCNRPAFAEGPMAIMVDQLVERFQGYEMSHLGTDRVSFVSERLLADTVLPRRRKAMAFKGKKKPAETKYFFENARALAVLAKRKSEEVQDKVIAVLFRDADGTASAGRGNWRHKRQSMIEGFKAEAFDLGVAMIPQPKSEAWLLCATKQQPYQHCDTLEEASGNDKAPDSLKSQLAASLNGSTSTADLNQLLRDQVIDVTQIDMPSFNVFKEDLESKVVASG